MTTTIRLIGVFFVAVLTVAGGCGGSESPTDPTSVAETPLAPSKRLIIRNIFDSAPPYFVGDKWSLAANLAEGEEILCCIRPGNVAWGSDAPAVATVVPRGLFGGDSQVVSVTAVGAGEATIFADTQLHHAELRITVLPAP